MTLLRSITIGFAALAWLGCSSAANDGAVTGSTQAAISGDSADAGAELPKLCDPSACGALPTPPERPKGAPDGDDDDGVAKDDGGAPLNAPPPPPPPAPPGAQGDQDSQGPQGPLPGGDCGGDKDGPKGGKRHHRPPPLACVEVAAGQCAWRPLPPPRGPRPPRGGDGKPGDGDGKLGDDDGGALPPLPPPPPPEARQQ